MLKTLRSKILFYFLLVSMSGILIVSFSIQWGFEASFNHYINQNRAESTNQLVKALKLEYKENGAFTGERVTQLLYQQATTDSLYYKIYSPDEILLIDSTSISTDGIPTESGGRTNPYQEDNWQTSMELIKVNGKTIGIMKVY